MCDEATQSYILKKYNPSEYFNRILEVTETYNKYAAAQVGQPEFQVQMCQFICQNMNKMKKFWPEMGIQNESDVATFIETAKGQPITKYLSPGNIVKLEAIGREFESKLQDPSFLVDDDFEMELKPSDYDQTKQR